MFSHIMELSCSSLESNSNGYLIESYRMLIGRNDQIRSSDWFISLGATSGTDSNAAREVTQLEKERDKLLQFNSFRELSFDIQIFQRHKGMSR